MEKYIIDEILTLVEKEPTAFDKYMSLSKIIDELKIYKRIYLDDIVAESYNSRKVDNMSKDTVQEKCEIM